ncbi:hypothetical protein [Virgibacillus kimchii]
MLPEDRRTINNLVRKVKQQEDTITQLVNIIAATNRRITDVLHRMEKEKLPKASGKIQMKKTIK